MFLQIVGMVVGAETSEKSDELPAGETGTAGQPEKTAPIGGPEDQDPEEPSPAPEAVVPEAKDQTADPEDPAPAGPEQLKEKPKGGAWGFLLLRCSHCGHDRALYAKNLITTYRCPECKKRTQIDSPLRRAYVKCECGHRETYRTNVMGELLDVPCVSCHAPVACEYNERAGAFTTIREGSNQRHQKKHHIKGDNGEVPALK